MTPVALIVFGAFIYALFRSRFIFLSIVFDLINGVKIARRRRRKVRLTGRGGSQVMFFTSEQVWGDEKKRKSA